jgi:hypothetical protein
VTSSIGWPVVATSSLIGLAVLAPAAGLAWLAADDPGRAMTWLFLAAALLAFSTAGFAAGFRRRDIPMIHGCLAALGTFVVATFGGIGLQVARGGGVSFAAVALGALVASSCGVGGALGADWLARRRRRRSDLDRDLVG